MPLYSYHCNDCNADYNRITKIADREDGGECKECGSENTQQALTAPLGVSGCAYDRKIRLSKPVKS